MRHRGGAPNAAARMAEAAAARAVKNGSKKKAVRGISDEAFLRCLDEVKAMLAGGSWGGAVGRHFVALYADLHYRVYGIEAIELGTKERVFAAKFANVMLEKDFAGDRDAFARFVSWTWTRERSREQWRREHGKSGGRMTWRSQFSRGLLTDYRIEEARKAAQR